ncbi:MAG: ATP-binding protein [Bacteriovoracales bacterium]|nr:ATP-binding protein [Bacteriovoracales bacterium]
MRVQRYRKRDAEVILKELAGSYPVVSVTGPRQSGKTTLVRTLFPHKSYVNLEDLELRNYAKQDPKGFLGKYQKVGAIIDEVQNVPELFSYLQVLVDKSRQMGQFILIGSQQFSLMSNISQSLAGRVGLLELLPFSLSELRSEQKSLEETLYRGFYPPLHDRSIRTHLWHGDYIRTYIERDVRKLINIKDLSLFQNFLSLCAARNGQLINMSELGSHIGIDARTVKSWLSILEASYLIFLLRPHHRNFSKKIIKTPKIYFYDSGLICYLLQIKAEDIHLSPYKGPLFESMIISEFKKLSMNHRHDLEFYFWKNNKGIEVDLLFQKSMKLYPIEIKSGKTMQESFLKNLKVYRELVADDLGKPFLIYGGDEPQSRNKIEVLSWKNLAPLMAILT